MRSTRVVLIAAIALLSWTAALANERGMVIRAGDLFAEPFIDAAKLGPLNSNQPVTIVERRGGWLAVEVGGRRGWVRMLNVRLEIAARPAASTAALRTGSTGRIVVTGVPGATPGRSTAALRTGSTGRTVATGVKGLDEVDIRGASIDRAQLAQLERLAVSDGDARQHAAQNNLKETKVDYLKPGKDR